MIDLALDGIKDSSVKDNFITISEELRAQDIFNASFKHYTVTFSGPVSDYPFRHGLRFIPKDIWKTSTIGVGNVDFDYSTTNATFIYMSATDACTVRFFAGNFSTNSRA